MEFKLVISDPKTGRSYQRELKGAEAGKFRNQVIGDEVDGSAIGLSGYKLAITGGSDKCGFPMKKGVHGTRRPKILLAGGVGYNPKKEVRKRKRVRGEQVGDDVVQVNAKITAYGKKGVEELLGASEAPAEGGEEASDDAGQEKAGKSKEGDTPKEEVGGKPAGEESKGEKPGKGDAPKKEEAGKPEEKDAPREEPKEAEAKGEPKPEKPAEETTPKKEEAKAEDQAEGETQKKEAGEPEEKKPKEDNTSSDETNEPEKTGE